MSNSTANSTANFSAGSTAGSTGSSSPGSADISAILAAQSWRITCGSPTAEEVAAIAVVLASALAPVADPVALDPRDRRPAARWTPSAARRKAATSWAAAPQPNWRSAA